MLLMKDYPTITKYCGAEAVNTLSPFRRTVTKAACYEILYVVRDGLTVTDEREEHVLSCGDVFVLFPNTGAELTSEACGVAFYSLRFFVLAPEKIGFDQRQICAADNVRLHELFKYLIRMAENPAYTDAMYQSCIGVILAEIAVAQSSSDQDNHRFDLMMSEVRHWLMMNMSDTSRPLETVAAQFGYSKYHISRIFKKTYGQSIHEYIDELKIARAINLLLNTDRSVNQIAEELGYPSADSFIKFFKYHRSCSPGAFRRNLKQNGSEKG